MRYLRATSGKQLDICLRMLFFDKVHYIVRTVENDRHKIEYRVELTSVDDGKADELEERYRILIS